MQIHLAGSGDNTFPHDGEILLLARAPMTRAFLLIFLNFKHTLASGKCSHAWSRLGCAGWAGRGHVPPLQGDGKVLHCHLLPIPVPAGATEAEHGAHPASLRDAAKCRIRAGAEGGGDGRHRWRKPGCQRGDGNTMPSLLALIYGRSDTLCAVARGCMRMSLSQ